MRYLAAIVAVIIIILMVGNLNNTETNPFVSLTLEDVTDDERQFEMGVIRGHLIELHKNVGPEEMYAQFLDFVDSLPEDVNQHVLMHLAGDFLYDEYGYPAHLYCDGSYDYGCMHSVLGNTFYAEGESSITEVTQMCLSHEDEESVNQCLHGLGHGFVNFLGYEDVEPSIDLCARLEDSTETFVCLEGVFMEYNRKTILVVDGAGSPRSVAEWGRYYPCDIIESKYRPACYFRIPSWWNKVEVVSFKDFGNYCSTLEEPLDRKWCMHGMGRVVFINSEYDEQSVEGAEKCLEVSENSEDRVACFQTVRWFHNFYYPENDSDFVCDGLEDTEKAACLLPFVKLLND